MENYKNILVAIEINPTSDRQLIDAAQEIAKKTGAKLTLVHAIEHIGGYGGIYGITMVSSLEEEIKKKAEMKMVEIGVAISVPAERQIVDFGAAKILINQEAEERKIDLIIVGSHGRQGIQMLIGSTANAVLHKAKCDVLVVRIKS